jgi:hypothetical protein
MVQNRASRLHKHIHGQVSFDKGKGNLVEKEVLSTNGAGRVKEKKKVKKEKSRLN